MSEDAAGWATARSVRFEWRKPLDELAAQVVRDKYLWLVAPSRAEALALQWTYPNIANRIAVSEMLISFPVIITTYPEARVNGNI